MNILRWSLLSGTVLASAAFTSSASAATVSSTFLFSDQATNQIVLSVDRNGDGDMNDAGETTSFFDSGNLSGLTGASGNVFSLSQSKTNKTILIGEGNTDSVYRLSDNNADGDANDADEAHVWFSGSDNAEGFKLNTPNGIAEGPDGAVYIVEADTTGSPTGDWVYRTVDLNGDGDANDEGEATKWLSLTGLNSASSPFEIRFDGDTAYIMDTAGTTPDVIYRAVDANGDNVIGAGEVTAFATEGQAFGANFDFAMDTYKGGLLTWQWLASSGVSAVYSLHDLNGNGIIDQASEVVQAWSTTLLGAGYTFLAGFGLSVNQETGEVLITSNASGANGDWIIRLLDLDGDGTFFGAGEWSFVLDRLDQGTYPDRPRNVSFYDAPEVSPVPVPGALPLLASGLVGLGVLARRRKQRNA
ncbi:VPLPA-CTERM sorting domain-containing protein [Aestuariivirga sp.]|uniref:VPLPA-CTERM sorting domain-containing protein n=1 Tax=Aestuariivirga sp. TaxID=2650926 RepID=UPI0039E3EF66